MGITATTGHIKMSHHQTVPQKGHLQSSANHTEFPESACPHLTDQRGLTAPAAWTFPMATSVGLAVLSVKAETHSTSLPHKENQAPKLQLPRGDSRQALRMGQEERRQQGTPRGMGRPPELKKCYGWF